MIHVYQFFWNLIFLINYIYIYISYKNFKKIKRTSFIKINEGKVSRHSIDQNSNKSAKVIDVVIFNLN